MRRWQEWFFGRWGQALIWIGVIAVGWLLLANPGSARGRWWWPFERSDQPFASSTRPIIGDGALSSELTAVAKAAMPAVVNIASSRTVRGPSALPGPFFSDPFFRFFGEPELGPRRERSLGSGVLVTADGVVITNSHVVEGAQDIKVTLADRRELTGKLIGADPKTDLAILKLPGRDFPILALGDSSRVEVAEVVLAVGNPFGLSQTVTMGIVSAVGRANLGIADYEDFIQTDAAINPGNSGGALVNVRGELIGINTAIFSQSGGYQGIGFAVPVHMARQVMEQLVSRGAVTRGYLGVAVQEVTPAIARGLGIPEARGILVSDVVRDGPAAKAGLQRGDLITTVDGKPVNDVGHFRNLIAGLAPSTKVKLTVLRGGREQVVDLTVGELSERAQASVPSKARPDRLGISARDVTPEMAGKLGLPPGTQGAVVVDVLPGGLAAESDLRPGDVVVEVNRKPVRSVRDLARAAEEAQDKDLVLLVNRGGSTAYVAIERAG
jgi:serine protease Do